MLVASLWCIFTFWTLDCAVLDPSLYLAPSPPLTDISGSLTPAETWSRSTNARDLKEAIETVPPLTANRLEPKRIPDPAEKAKLFWPSSRVSHYSVGSADLQVPLTFGISGLYGKISPGTSGSGIIGSTYGTMSQISGSAVAALAGTGYGNYKNYPGIRIYTGENGPAWSGWGNGKWGHYGKG